MGGGVSRYYFASNLYTSIMNTLSPNMKLNIYDYLHVLCKGIDFSSLNLIVVIHICQVKRDIDMNDLSYLYSKLYLLQPNKLTARGSKPTRNLETNTRTNSDYLVFVVY